MIEHAAGNLDPADRRRRDGGEFVEVFNKTQAALLREVGGAPIT